MLSEAVKELKAAGAILKVSEQITPMGCLLARLPVDIPIGKIIILGCIFEEILPVALTLAASYCTQGLFVRKGSGPEMTPEELADRHRYDSVHGDCFTAVNVFTEWVKRKSRREDTRRWCRKHWIEEQRLYEMVKLRRQFTDMLQDSGVVSKENGRTKQESARRERHFLTTMRKDRDANAGRRVLRTDDALGEEEEEVESFDMRHIQLLLSTDIDQYKRSIDTKLSHRHLNVIRTILCCALYPNFALTDEGNSNRMSTEFLYNTRYRQFTSMHPSNAFYGSEDAVSHKNVICYQKLLETKTVYLVNCFAAPLISSLLLCAKSIDTCKTLKRLLIDGWVLLVFDKADVCEKVLMTVCELRAMIDRAVQNLLRVKFALSANAPQSTELHAPLDASVPACLHQIRALQHSDEGSCALLHDRLGPFLDASIPCQARYLKHNEVIKLLISRDAVLNHEEVVNDVELVHTLKSGARVTDFLMYGSVRDDHGGEGDSLAANHSSTSRHMKTYYKCPRCGMSAMLNSEEVNVHLRECGSDCHSGPDGEQRDVKTAAPQPVSALRSPAVAKTPAAAGPKVKLFGNPIGTERADAKIRESVSNSKSPGCAEGNHSGLQTAERSDLNNVESAVGSTSRGAAGAAGRDPASQSAQSTRVRYACPECQQSFLFTKAEILRHKSSHDV